MTNTSVIVYTISSCPASKQLMQDLRDKGITFEERQVDMSQAWLDEAVKHGDTVPLAVYPDGRVEVGYPGMIG